MRNSLRPQKFYKIRVKQNVIRQALLTDKILILLIILLIFGASFLFLQKLTFDNKILISIVLTGFLLVGLSIKVDGQNFYEILFRAIRFALKKKNEIIR